MSCVQRYIKQYSANGNDFVTDLLPTIDSILAQCIDKCNPLDQVTYNHLDAATSAVKQYLHTDGWQTKTCMEYTHNINHAMRGLFRDFERGIDETGRLATYYKTNVINRDCRDFIIFKNNLMAVVNINNDTDNNLNPTLMCTITPYK